MSRIFYLFIFFSVLIIKIVPKFQTFFITIRNISTLLTNSSILIYASSRPFTGPSTDYLTPSGPFLPLLTVPLAAFEG